MAETKFGYVDCHAHVNFAAFDADREAVLARAREAGAAVINVGTQLDTSQKAVELAEHHDGVFAIVGLHPVHTSQSFHDEKEMGEGGKEFTSRGEVFSAKNYQELLAHPKVVGVGECGLDYYRAEAEAMHKQREAFIAQIHLANGAEKPLMLHIRNGSGRSAYHDAYEILKAESQVRANLHFFAGSVEEAKPFLDMHYTFSFTGVITFAKEYEEIVRYLPLERVLSETDSPYVAPAPFRGRRNEPAYVPEVVRAIARIRDEDGGKVAAQLFDNARRLFRLVL